MFVIDYAGVPLEEVASSRNIHICSPHALAETQPYIFFIIIIIIIKISRTCSLQLMQSSRATFASFL